MDIRLNKKAAAFAGGVVSMACLVACGDDITQVTNVGMDSVAAYEDLSECTTQNEGVLIYVKDKGNTYLCSDESWHSVKGEDGKNGTNGTNGKSAFDLAKEQDPSLTLANWLASLKGANGSNGTNCSVSKSGSVTTIDCGNGNTATISDGASGTNGKSAYELANTELSLEAWLASLKGANGSNGTNCSVSKSGSTTTIDCGGENTATITDGAPGSSGSQGPKGDPGSSGSKGADGVGCSVQSDGNGGAIVICGASSSSVAISKGEPGSSGSKGDTGYGCDIVDDGSGTLSVKCGPDGNPTSTATIYKAVCGTTPYDPAAKFCVGVTLYELCGDNKETYDPTGYECVEGVVKEKITAAMCGTDTYDPETQFCAMRNNVVERIYKKVTIAPEGTTYSKTWMAENLNYDTENSWCGGGSGETEGDCSVYGRLYTYDAAMAACPDGWHLPTKAEFETLITSAGGSLDAGKALKSKSDWNGSDDFTFSALPAGFREEDGQFLNKGDEAYFWSSTETEVDDRVYVMGMYSVDDDGEYEDDGAHVLKRDKNYGRSVRCIQNDPQ
ncbi:FISUMP domain-containing protein [Fibrobacter sp.]|uniref:FISUMP domain-containing protein n=1 Tax=Fibrobacter sp. TaxID=35828 RepID=UPI0038704F49